MTVVVVSGSRQYVVEQGQQIIVDRLTAEEGATVTLPIVFAFGEDEALKGEIEATVLKHQRGVKVRVTKYRPKSNYHRHYGPRQEETILIIGTGPAKKAKKTVTKEEATPKVKKVVSKKQVTIEK